MGGSFRGPTTKGSLGLQAADRRKDSDFMAVNWSGTGKQGVKAARIYFDTNDAEVRGNGNDVLKALGLELSTFLLADLGTAEVTCDGHADIRGTEKHNMKLSKERAEKVKAFLERTDLGPCLGCTFNPVKPKGEENQPKEKHLWPEGRRVDVTVAVTPLKEIQARRGDTLVKRARIFQKFYPHYDLWKSRRLEYLVEQYEYRFSGASGAEHNVIINSLDYNKVLDLIQQPGLLPDSERRSLAIELKALNNRAAPGGPEKLTALGAITDAYGRVYSIAYQIALNAYEKAFWDYWKNHPAYTRDKVQEELLR